MPAPERTSLDEIVAAALELLDEGGLGALTMQAVATRVGVRAPSLYKRVADRTALVERVFLACAAELDAVMRAAAERAGSDGGDRIVAIVVAARDYAHAHPHRYHLIFGGVVTDADPAALERSAEPIVAACRALVGPDRALDAARTVTAWAQGFLLMELSGSFRLGGDVEQAFLRGARWIADALVADRDQRLP